MDGARTEEHVVGGITMKDFEQVEAVETLVFAKRHQWETARVKVTGMFEMALGDHWQSLLYAPVYEDFWQPILDELDKLDYPLVEVKLHVTHEFGVADQANLDASMAGWRTRKLTKTKPQVVVAALRDDQTGLLAVNHMMVDRIEMDKVPLE